MPKTGTIASCQATIKKLLPVRYPTLDHTAGLLRMPVRTLQRRLQQGGVSYSQLVEQTRRETARHMLRRHDMRISEIAATLGYADPASFTRAFHRWTGMSPRAYRQKSNSGVTQQADAAPSPGSVGGNDVVRMVERPDKR